MAWAHRTHAQELEVVALTRDHCQREIAELTGLSKAVVVDVQRKYHLVLSFGRSYSSARHRYAYDEREWEEAIERLYHERRMSLAAVADQLGVDVGTVRRRMDALGINRRTSGQSNAGKKRGRYRGWLERLPRCEADGCERGVGKEGEVYCSTCRRKRRLR